MRNNSKLKRVAILQSNYIPWKGYFDLINMVDEFIIFDTVQYTKRDWRNRNKIKTKNGVHWLTIPVKVKGKYYQPINETEMSDPSWQEKHWSTISHCYKHAPYFDLYKDDFEKLYKQCSDLKLLSDINYLFITNICLLLDIKTKITHSTDYDIAENDKTKRLVSICQKADANLYLSGPAAKEYMALDLFKNAGIEVQWMDYNGYPEYSQLYPPFDHHVSIIDLLFSVGPEAKSYMKSFN